MYKLHLELIFTRIFLAQFKYFQLFVFGAVASQASKCMSKVSLHLNNPSFYFLHLKTVYSYTLFALTCLIVYFSDIKYIFAKQLYL